MFSYDFDKELINFSLINIEEIRSNGVLDKRYWKKLFELLTRKTLRAFEYLKKLNWNESTISRSFGKKLIESFVNSKKLEINISTYMLDANLVLNYALRRDRK